MTDRLAMGLVLTALLLSGPYLLAVWRAPRWSWRRARWWILGIGLALRLALLPLPTVLTTDLHRYLWEGRVQLAGFNPYRLAPDAPELVPLRDSNWQQLDHREVPSSYPPLLLLVFRAVARIAADDPQAELLFKLLFAAADLAVVGILAHLLRRSGRNPSLALVWAWSPLVIIEFAGNGHALSVAILCFLAGLAALAAAEEAQQQPRALGISARREARPPQTVQTESGVEGEPPGEPCAIPRSCRLPLVAAGALFGAAIQTHYLAAPFVLAIVLARRPRSPWFWGTGAGVTLAPFLLFADAGRDLVLGLTHVAGRWRFNGSVYEVLARLSRDENPRRLVDGVWLAHEPAKLAGAIAVLTALGWVAWRRPATPRAALAVGGTLLLVSSTVHPWYVTWLVALSALEVGAAWVVWSATVLVAYLGILWGAMPGWLVGIEYGPVFILLAATMLRRSVDRS